MASIADDRGVEILGEHLSGRRIDLIVTGGIACIESPRLARELRRYGADVRAIMTPAALKFISPLSLEWATKQSVVSELSGAAEHISHADVVVVYPCTLDFLTKISLGLADSAAATAVQSILGRQPLVIVSSMHDSLAKNPIFQERLSDLQRRREVYFIDPVFEEGKAKVPDVEDVTARICHWAGRNSALRNRSVVLSLGPTRSKIDDMRFVSNRSTGALGIAIADELFRRGGSVKAVAGPTEVSIPTYISCTKVESNSEMLSAFQAAVLDVKPDAAIFAAAVLDFEVKSPSSGKSTSKRALNITLDPTTKLIQKFKAAKFLKVGFKLEAKISERELVSRARIAMGEQGTDILVANRLEDVSREKHQAFILTPASKEPIKVQGKKKIASAIADSLERMVQNFALSSKAKLS